MLNALKIIPLDIKGADPDSDDPENEWFRQRLKPPVKASKPGKATAKKRMKKTSKKAVKKASGKAVGKKAGKSGKETMKPGYTRRLL